MNESSELRRRGRPLGAKSQKTEVVEKIPAACPHCHATGHKVLRIAKEMEHGGLSPSGNPRTHIVWRRCQCDHCGGYFVEMSHENRTSTTPPPQNSGN
jgi:hypothetical protein